MQELDTFVNIKNQNFFFNGCSNCEGECCNGAKGFALAPLILEDFIEVYKNFAIVFAINNRKLKAYVVLNNGKEHCKYYIDDKCSIYEQRTPACKLYPVSPYFDDILVDTHCPSINSNDGIELCSNGKLNSNFYTKRLDNFSEKLEKSIKFYNSIYNINDFKFIGDILGMGIFKYTKQSENKYIKMHQESLRHWIR